MYEQVPVFLLKIAYNRLNFLIKYVFQQPEKIVSYHFHIVLQALVVLGCLRVNNETKY